MNTARRTSVPDPQALQTFLELLSQRAPQTRVLVDREDVEVYSSDWTRTPGQGSLVVLPADAAGVAAVLGLCSELALPVVPSGGRTGLAGGAVAAAGEIILSLERLNRIIALDPLSRSVRVQAGVTTQAVHEFCAKKDLFWPIDLASKGSCHVGGNLSTNAGGLRVIRYGGARKWVTSLQIATVTGELIELNSGLEKNNTGYDLIQLILGSEGTLAVITEVTLKLVRLPNSSQKSVYFFGVSDLEALDRIFELARSGPFEISAFEFFSDRCLGAVESALGRKSRLATKSAFYAILEVEGTEARDGWLERVVNSGAVEDAFEANSSEERTAVWGLREGITESLQRRAPVRKYDVCVSVNATASFLKEALDFATPLSAAMELFVFGHFGDGSPHFNLVRPAKASEERFQQAVENFERYLFDTLKAYRGTISAEHGVGMLKRSWVQFSRTQIELDWFRKIKAAFDPQGILNPGKVIPDQGDSGF